MACNMANALASIRLAVTAGPYNSCLEIIFTNPQIALMPQSALRRRICLTNAMNRLRFESPDTAELVLNPSLFTNSVPHNGWEGSLVQQVMILEIARDEYRTPRFSNQ